MPFGGRRLWAVEVVQTSAMDCGPAALKCLLQGFGIPVSYDRLREACQTDVDGTSIDTLEEVAGQLGLDAEQVLVPVDHLLLPEARLLPALLVVRLPNGFTHFVVVWRRHGPWYQVMDPAVGRRWVSASRLAQEIHLHAMPVAASAWREWAGTSGFKEPLERRIARVTSKSVAANLMLTAEADASWFGFGVLDAATRLVEALVRARGVRAGREAGTLLRSRLDDACQDPASAETRIPHVYWAARRANDRLAQEGQIELRGAILLRVTAAGATSRAEPRSAALASALREPRSSPWSVLLASLRDQGAYRPTLLGLAALSASTLITLEAVLFSGAISVGSRLGLPEQRFGAAVALMTLSALLLALDSGMASATARLGRRLEIGLRSLFLSTMLTLPPRFLGSRPISDLAERLHAAYRIRTFPRDGLRIIQVVLQIIFTGAAMAWIGAPAGLVLASVFCAITGPLLLWPLLFEQDMRVRTHTGALSRFYFETLAGLVTLRAHAAGEAIRREQESQIVDWVHASRARLGTVLAMDLLQGITGFGLAIWILLRQAQMPGATGPFLLLAYWALTLPLLGEEFSVLVRRLPNHRSITLRLVEPVRAAEAEVSAPIHETHGRNPPGAATSRPGVALAFSNVSVMAGGHRILEDVSVSIGAGEHVAILGASGAGKSSLVSLALGVLQPSTGQICADGLPLSAEGLERLRSVTAWIDPAIQIWNRTLLDNLLFGTASGAEARVGGSVHDAALQLVLARLPRGMQEVLGEGGGSLSGGEGQLVRVGRAMLRDDVRLAVLDEGFRGLDADQRALLLERCRCRWESATMLVVTHDVATADTFDRVLVLAHGRLVEEGTPRELRERSGSHYCQLLTEAAGASETLWGRQEWTRWRMDRGQLTCE